MVAISRRARDENSLEVDASKILKMVHNNTNKNCNFP